MTVRLKDVAARTGLDLSTVSRVLNNPDKARVSRATRERVQRVAAEQGYRVNATAQALARGATDCIGLMIPDLLDPVLMQYADLLGRGLEGMGRQAIPVQTGWHAADERRALRAFGRGQVDAVVSLAYRPENRELYSELSGLGVPLVFRVGDLPVEEVPFDCVGVDISDAYEHLLRHLHARGYRRIGVVGGLVADELARHDAAMTATRAIMDTARELGLTFGPAQAIPCPANTAVAAAAAVTRALAGRAGRFDAFIVQSNKLLLGVWHAIRMAGLRIPEQVGLAVVSDSEVARLLDVPVTVWNQPVRKICAGLLRLLNRKLDGDAAIHRIQYESGLTVRASTRRKG